MIAPLAALSFLTRLPVGKHPRREEIAASIGWFPAVGLVLGVLVLVVDRITMRALPPPAVDVLLVVTLAALTGALHLDGLADTFDGLFGGYTPERRLQIMRDVQTGTFGVVAVVSVLALKWAGFNALPSDVRVEAILLAPCAARFAILPAIAAFPYARDGVGAGYREHAAAGLVLGAVTMVAAAAVLLGFGGVTVIALALACGLGIGWLASRMVGGVTGDIFGAIVEVSEAFALLLIAALARREWIDAWLFG